MPDFGLSTLNGVTFSAGAISEVTSVSDADYAANSLTVTGVTQTGPFYAFYPGWANDGFTVELDDHGSPGIKYRDSPVPGSDGARFAFLYSFFPSLHYGSYYHVVGFGYHALLVTGLHAQLEPGAAGGKLYVINLTYGDNSLVPPTPITAPLTFSADPAALITPPCFAEGTRIATPRGEVAVEDLAEGDEVVTASGATRPVIWIGSRRVRIDAYPHPREVKPVRVRAGAFGQGLPRRDLRLSPGHAVFTQGVLVPVGALVNGVTIVQEEAEQVHYFHVELDAHDVLLAEGLPCESYLDDGNREVFANGSEHVALYGRLDPLDWDGACAPVLKDWDADHEALAAVRARLHGEAEALGWRVTDEPGLTLLADGVAIAPLHRAGQRYWFRAPAAGQLALISGSGRPFDLTPGHMDLRRLGVAISEARVDGQRIDLGGDAFGAGFHDLEQRGDAAWRWTDGAGCLLVQGPALIEVMLHMTALSWVRPASHLRLIGTQSTARS